MIPTPPTSRPPRLRSGRRRATPLVALVAAGAVVLGLTAAPATADHRAETGLDPAQTSTAIPSVRFGTDAPAGPAAPAAPAADGPLVAVPPRPVGPDLAQPTTKADPDTKARPAGDLRRQTALVTGRGDRSAAVSASASLAPAAGPAADVSVEPTTTTRADLRDVVFSGSGFTPGESVRMLLTPPGGQQIDLTAVFPEFADDAGAFSYTYTYANASRAWYGDYRVELVGELSGATGDAAYTVTRADGDLVDDGTARIAFDPASLTQSAMWSDGLGIAVSGLAAGEPVTAGYLSPLGDYTSGLELGEGVAGADGTLSERIYAASTASFPGTYGLVVGSESTGSTLATWTVEPDPSDDPQPAPGATASIAPQEITPIQLALQGVRITAAGFAPGESVRFEVTLPAGNTLGFGSSPAEDDGTYSSPFYDSSGRAPVGTYRITLIGATSGYVSASFAVIVDPNPPVVDPRVTVEPERLDQAAASLTGWTVDGDGFIPGDVVQLGVTYPTGVEMVLGGFLVDEDGGWHAEGVTLPDPVAPPGDYTLHFIGRLDGRADVPVTITESTPPADSTLTVTATPQTINPRDFHETGVQLEVAGAAPGDPLVLVLVPPGGALTALATGTTDEQGAYALTLAPLASAPDLGTYEVRVYTASRDAGSTTFVVDPDAGTPDADVDLTLSRSTVSARELGTDGIDVTATGLDAGETVDLVVVRPNGRRTIVATRVATAQGVVRRHLTYLTTTLAAGDYQLRVEGTVSGFQRTVLRVTGSTSTPAPLTLQARATIRRPGGRTMLAVRGTNPNDVAVSLRVRTRYGTRHLTRVEPGAAFSTRIATHRRHVRHRGVLIRVRALDAGTHDDLVVRLWARAVRAAARSTARDYREAADRLPAGLQRAVRRDLGLTPARYLAEADAAHLSQDVADALGDTAAPRTWVGTDGRLRVLVDGAADSRLVTGLGAVPVTDDPLGDRARAANRRDDGRTWYADRAAGTVRSYDPTTLRTLDVRAGELEGGDGYIFGKDGGTYRCSLAFAGVGAFGQPVQLTAGHCVEGTDRAAGAHVLDLDAPVAYGGELTAAQVVGQIGWTGSGEVGNDNDGGLLTVNDDYTAAPVVSTWGGGRLSQDDGVDVPVYDSVGAVAGMPVCKSGATTGWTCGTVIDADSTETIGDGASGLAGTVNAFIFDACILSGDSGGAILSGNYALGVDSFGNMATCDDAGRPGFLSGGFAVRSGSSNVATQFGEDFNLEIAVGTPTLDAPPAGTRVRSLHGTVAAAPGTVVTVTVDGRAYTTTATTAGSWTLPLPAELAVGAHVITLRAAHHATGSLVTTRSTTGRTTLTVG